jgi:protein O-mannosyl-transferase
MVNKQPQKKQPAKKKVIKDNAVLHKLYLWVGLIIFITLVSFSPGLWNDLVSWDDFNYIRDNPVIKSLAWDNILYIFNYKTFIMGNYHPFTIISYALEYKIAGISPFLYHFDNILLHIINVALFAWLMWLLTGKFYATIIATALFAVHPMRVESVVWAAERKDVLYTLFYLLALISYIFYITKPDHKSRNYVVALLMFLFSILSKGQAVVLPLTFLLADYWYHKKITRQLIVEKVPFFALSLLFGILAILAQSSSLTAERLVSHTLAERFLFAGYNITAYLYKLVYPYSLACFYGYLPSDQMYKIFLGAVCTLVILTFVFYRYRQNRTVMFGTLFFLCTIFIVIQLMPIGNALIADRYTYIPYIGLFFIIGVLADWAFQSDSTKWKVVKYLVVIQLVIFSAATFIQSTTWKNSETIFQQVLKINPREGMAYNNLGVVYLDTKEYPKAIDVLFKSLKYRETYPEAFRSYHNLGKAFSETGKRELGIQYYDTAISMAPGSPDAIFARGLTYTEMGQYDKAISDFTTVLTKINPKHAESYYSRAIAYNKKNQKDSAIADYTRAVEVKPDYSGAYTNRGNIYFNNGNLDEAISDYTMSLKFEPDNGTVYLNRSFAYFKRHSFSLALEDAEKASGLKTAVNQAYINDLKSFIAKGQN